MKLGFRTLFLLLVLSIPLVAGDTFSVATYNVENWVTTDRMINGKRVKAAPKPESEKAAVIAIIKNASPDILIVQEMGNAADFEDFKKRLHTAGLGYVDAEHVIAGDSRISLALLSRFPITGRYPKTGDVFEIRGNRETVKRGFLDVAIAIPDGPPLRVMGAHLKSRKGQETDTFPSLLRRREALALRGHVTDFLGSNPEECLIIGGDLNDTVGSEALKTILGGRNSEFRLYDLWLHDWTGDRWTHYYQYQREYSQIDFLIVNNRLLSHFLKDREVSYVQREKPGDSPELTWDQASDHRLVKATFSKKPIPREKKKDKKETEETAP